MRWLSPGAMFSLARVCCRCDPGYGQNVSMFINFTCDKLCMSGSTSCLPHATASIVSGGSSKVGGGLYEL